jgi:hypothetical protein
MTMIIDGTNGLTFNNATTQASAGLVTGGTLATATITSATLPTATITTLNTPSGVLATQNGMTGIAKAWVSFTGSTGTITKAFNVSSVTRSATGTYVINFSTAMVDSGYAITWASATGGTSTAGGVSAAFTSPTTSNVALTFYVGTSGYDSTQVYVAILGN